MKQSRFYHLIVTLILFLFPQIYGNDFEESSSSQDNKRSTLEIDIETYYGQFEDYRRRENDLKILKGEIEEAKKDLKRSSPPTLNQETEDFENPWEIKDGRISSDSSYDKMFSYEEYNPLAEQIIIKKWEMEELKEKVVAFAGDATKELAPALIGGGVGTAGFFGISALLAVPVLAVTIPAVYVAAPLATIIGGATYISLRLGAGNVFKKIPYRIANYFREEPLLIINTK